MRGSVQFSPSDLVSLISFVRERHLADTERPSIPRAEDGDMAGVRSHCALVHSINHKVTGGRDHKTTWELTNWRKWLEKGRGKT